MFKPVISLLTCILALTLTNALPNESWAQAGDPAQDIWADEKPAPTTAPQWTKEELDKGYVVFKHSTLENLPADYVPARETILTDWNTLPVKLARGESESIFLGVHSVKDLSLRDTWAEPTVSPEDRLDVRVYTRGAELRQLLPGKVIERIPSGTTGGFWLTFTAREDTPTGKHSIRLEIIPCSPYVKETVLTVEVEVRPCTLPRARASFAGYYALSIDGIPMGWVRYMNNAKWREACYADMLAYGMTSVDFRPLGPWGTSEGELLLEGDPNKGLLRMTDELARAAKVGLTDPHTPVIVLEGQEPRDAKTLSVFAPRLVAFAKARNWPEMLVYLTDEPRYPDPETRRVNLQFRRSGLRTATSMSMDAAYGHGDVIAVWIMYGGDITPELLAEAHRLGAEVWTYTCHIFSGQPLRNRFYAGLYTWAHGAGGNWIWAYYRNTFHNCLVWSETAEHDLFPTMGYEARREGIDDYRYLQALQDALAAHPEQDASREAGEFLETLRSRVISARPNEVGQANPLTIAEYDDIREEVAGLIDKIGSAPSRDYRPWKSPGLKDEAASFRDRTVEQCMTGLSNTDVAVRRAAASALYERGPEASAATNALVGLLADPDTRIPALRALEAVGPKAEAAVPKVAALVTHNDEFVRLGSVYTLRAMASSSEASIEGLRKALKDEARIAYVASAAVAEIGAPAQSLAPELAANLDRPGTALATEPYDLGTELAIKALGANAASAVPAIIKLFSEESRPERVKFYLTLLAAIGPGAKEATRAVEKRAAAKDACLPDALYALFSIRGNSADLLRMVRLLDHSNKAGIDQRRSALRYISSLGVKAKPAAESLSKLLRSGRIDESVKGIAEETLRKIGGEAHGRE